MQACQSRNLADSQADNYSIMNNVMASLQCVDHVYASKSDHAAVTDRTCIALLAQQS